MSHDDGQVCLCRAEHAPQPLELHRHHILPQYLGGADEPGNVVWLCPTGHVGVHEILRELMKSGPLPWGDALDIWPGLNRYAFRLAHDGYARWQATQPKES